MDLTIIIPTFNEAPNVAELVRRIQLAVAGTDAEIVFVDDSNDDTPRVIEEVAAAASMPVRLLHRDDPQGGLSGAVLEGMAIAQSDWCLVMDGDLQHPPEVIPSLVARARRGGVDVVVASRYVGDGTAHGLANGIRTLVSRASTLVTKAMFPIRLQDCTDPMTGFFLVHRPSVVPDELQPRGFKILLELLARRPFRVAEVPFDFAQRFGGESKASLVQGFRFLMQLAMLRFGRMSGFALVGGLGAVANIAIVALLSSFGMSYLVASVIAAEVTILGNFALLERFVFSDLRQESGSMWKRLWKSFAFNNIESAIRIPIATAAVSAGIMHGTVATTVTLAIAFVVRFTFHSLVVYAPQRKARVSAIAKPDTAATVTVPATVAEPERLAS
ncbi:dolichol-phosphate mannosyltransferase [Labedella gwakjiensis]|uniref:Dolichol-phosphate mannosyltransferase n=1 Tax=Labedella gwakjiensis TaxID=390269 RepID=A0A2P8GRM5_9MICO|nr:glycosyltransferase family 2 protein [Labedella gwakjiensis]PSL36620.1 dolichol-phosphate mannosyltransferase [Labedella gwakjiensis]RUQ84144.1 glycosyltransferase family 2 protein [Labedella gwakjiensis]